MLACPTLFNKGDVFKPFSFMFRGKILFQMCFWIISFKTYARILCVCTETVKLQEIIFQLLFTVYVFDLLVPVPIVRKGIHKIRWFFLKKGILVRSLFSFSDNFFYFHFHYFIFYQCETSFSNLTIYNLS